MPWISGGNISVAGDMRKHCYDQQAAERQYKSEDVRYSFMR